MVDMTVDIELRSKVFAGMSRAELLIALNELSNAGPVDTLQKDLEDHFGASSSIKSAFVSRQHIESPCVPDWKLIPLLP
jgi:hypothetical protein